MDPTDAMTNHTLPLVLRERAAYAELAVFDVMPGHPRRVEDLLEQWTHIVDGIGTGRVMSVEWEAVLRTRLKLDELLRAAAAHNSRELLVWLLPRVEAIDEEFRARSSFDPEATGFSPNSLRPSMWWLRRQPRDPELLDKWKPLTSFTKYAPSGRRTDYEQVELADVVSDEFLRDCSGIDARDRDLSGAELSGVVFCGANLDGADLSGARLIGSDLTGASLRGASLDEADLRLVTAQRSDLTDALLRATRLDGADFAGADMMRADLSRVTARHARFGWADLTGASMIGADLDGVSLVNADLRGTDLSEATGLGKRSLLLARREGMRGPIGGSRTLDDSEYRWRQYSDWFDAESHRRGTPAAHSADVDVSALPESYAALLRIGSLDYLNDAFSGSLIKPHLVESGEYVVVGSLNGSELQLNTCEPDPIVEAVSGSTRHSLAPSFTRFIATNIARKPPVALCD